MVAVMLARCRLESWELFAIRLQQAEKKLLEAPKALKDNPLWHFLLLEIALNSNKVENSPQIVFENAVKRWPRGFAFYELLLTRMTPRWGGSWDLIDTFVKNSSQRLRASEGDSMYARLYLVLPAQDLALGITKMNWSRMKVSFADLIA
ncbi:hypothetical protein LP415_24785 [Polaromonas sp. P1(28)-8]|nr:hypothetical protein LP415_24785 [Polaromonas sp. P1(28)-8]